MDKGGAAVGFYVWLQHSPEDTGLPFFVYSKYQHLRELPALKTGERVKVGQVVGISGKSGTMGGHYGAVGYPHLHLTTVASPSGQSMPKGQVMGGRATRLIDPAALYVPGWKDIEDIAEAASRRGPSPSRTRRPTAPSRRRTRASSGRSRASRNRAKLVP